jgi:hypothetical protein
VPIFIGRGAPTPPSSLRRLWLVTAEACFDDGVQPVQGIGTGSPCGRSRGPLEILGHFCHASLPAKIMPNQAARESSRLANGRYSNVLIPVLRDCFHDRSDELLAFFSLIRRAYRAPPCSLLRLRQATTSVSARNIKLTSLAIEAPISREPWDGQDSTNWIRDFDHFPDGVVARVDATGPD